MLKMSNTLKMTDEEVLMEFEALFHLNKPGSLSIIQQQPTLMLWETFWWHGWIRFYVDLLSWHKAWAFSIVILNHFYPWMAPTRKLNIKLFLTRLLFHTFFRHDLFLSGFINLLCQGMFPVDNWKATLQCLKGCVF